LIVVGSSSHVEQVVSIPDHERLDEALGFLPVRLLAGLECDELDRQPHLLRPIERGLGGLGELVLLASSERVLELVTRERLDLREVTLGSEAEVRLALLVLLQLLVDDPATGCPFRESNEAEPGRVGPGGGARRAPLVHPDA
jgi:hypothetical protein